MITKILHKIVTAMNTIAALSAILMTGLVFFSVVMRYIVGSPFRFSDELVGLLFLTMAFLAVPLAQAQRRHITVDLIVEVMPSRIRAVMYMFGTLIVVVFGLLFVGFSYEYVSFSRSLGARSEVGRLLLWPWMALMPLSIFALILIAITQLYEGARLFMSEGMKDKTRGRAA